MYWTRILLIVQITTVRSSIIDPFRSFLWAISLNNSFLSFGNLSAERFLNYLLANYAFLNFDLLSVRSLNFPKISASFLIGPFFIIGDCVQRQYDQLFKTVAISWRIHYTQSPIIKNGPIKNDAQILGKFKERTLSRSKLRNA